MTKAPVQRVVILSHTLVVLDF